MNERTERRKRVLFLVAEDWFFAVHFLERARAIQAAGYDVAVATRVQDDGDRLREAGLTVYPLELARRGTNPLHELSTLAQIWKAYGAIKPDLVHHIAMKPILYGSFAAMARRVPAVVNELTGMGFIFTSTSVKRRIARQPLWLAYRWALGSGHTIVQNPDDLALLERKSIVPKGRVSIVYGAGVDTERFTALPEPNGDPLVVLPARMLTDKGVREFVVAARTLREAGVRVRCALVGTSDPANPASIGEEQLQAWADAGHVEWWGWRDDMIAVYAQASVVCLPSYREGLPRALIEAAACGRAIVTTDVPGCRAAVIHERNGLLVAPQDAFALAHAIRRLVEDAPLRERMGRNGRAIARERFSVDRVSADVLAIYRSQLNRWHADQ